MRGLFLIAVVATSGCGILLGADSDAPDAPPGDAGSEATPIDGAAADSGGDTGADAGDAGRGDAAATCLGVARPFIFCDDFEGNAIDPAWTSSAFGLAARISLSNTKPIRGSQSLSTSFASTTSPGDRAELRYTIPQGAPFAVQLWVRGELQSLSTTPTVRLFALQKGTQDSDGVSVLARSTTEGLSNLAYSVGVVPGEAGAADVTPLATSTGGTDVCFEMIWDGTRVTVWKGHDTQVTVKPPFTPTVLYVGVQNSSVNDVAFGATIDDVAVTPTPIGCP